MLLDVCYHRSVEETHNHKQHRKGRHPADELTDVVAHTEQQAGAVTTSSATVTEPVSEYTVPKACQNDPQSGTSEPTAVPTVTAVPVTAAAATSNAATAASAASVPITTQVSNDTVETVRQIAVRPSGRMRWRLS